MPSLTASLKLVTANYQIVSKMTLCFVTQIISGLNSLQISTLSKCTTCRLIRRGMQSSQWAHCNCFPQLQWDPYSGFQQCNAANSHQETKQLAMRLNLMWKLSWLKGLIHILKDRYVRAAYLSSRYIPRQSVSLACRGLSFVENSPVMLARATVLML